MSTLFSDTYTGVDTTNMGANYTESSGDTQIVSNRARLSANNPGIIRTTTTAHAAVANVRVSVTMILANTTVDGGPCSRVVNGAPPLATNMYAAEAWTSGAQGKLDLGRWDAGVFVVLVSTNITIAANVVVALEVTGTVAGAVLLTGYYGGVLTGTVTDTSVGNSIIVAQQTAIHNWAVAGTSSDYDNFLVEDVAVGAPPPLFRWRPFPFKPGSANFQRF